MSADRITEARRSICRTRGAVERAPKTPAAREAGQRNLRAKKVQLAAALRELDEVRRG
jgi:hypothetical protein